MGNLCKCYTHTIQSAQDNTCLAVDQSTGKLVIATPDENDISQQFVMMPDDMDNYNIFSVSKGKFLTSNGADGPITATSATPHSFEILIASDDTVAIADNNNYCGWKITDKTDINGGDFTDATQLTHFSIKAHSDDIL